MAIASLVLGIVGVTCCCLVIPGPLAVILGWMGIKQIDRDPSFKGRGMAIAGIVLGAVATVLFVLLIVVGNWDVDGRINRPLR